MQVVEHSEQLFVFFIMLGYGGAILFLGPGNQGHAVLLQRIILGLLMRQADLGQNRVNHL
jgi:hypothetical protein